MITGSEKNKNRRGTTRFYWRRRAKYRYMWMRFEASPGKWWVIMCVWKIKNEIQWKENGHCEVKKCFFLLKIGIPKSDVVNMDGCFSVCILDFCDFQQKKYLLCCIKFAFCFSHVYEYSAHIYDIVFWNSYFQKKKKKKKMSTDRML